MLFCDRKSAIQIAALSATMFIVDLFFDLDHIFFHVET